MVSGTSSEYQHQEKYLERRHSVFLSRANVFDGISTNSRTNPRDERADSEYIGWKGTTSQRASSQRGRDVSDLGSRLRLSLARKIRRFSHPHASRELMLLAMRRLGVKMQRKYVGESDEMVCLILNPAIRRSNHDSIKILRNK